MGAPHCRAPSEPAVRRCPGPEAPLPGRSAARAPRRGRTPAPASPAATGMDQRRARGRLEPGARRVCRGGASLAPRPRVRPWRPRRNPRRRVRRSATGRRQRRRRPGSARRRVPAGRLSRRRRARLWRRMPWAAGSGGGEPTLPPRTTTPAARQSRPERRPRPAERRSPGHCRSRRAATRPLPRRACYAGGRRGARDGDALGRQPPWCPPARRALPAPPAAMPQERRRRKSTVRPAQVRQVRPAAARTPALPARGGGAREPGGRPLRRLGQSRLRAPPASARHPPRPRRRPAPADAGPRRPARFAGAGCGPAVRPLQRPAPARPPTTSGERPRPPLPLRHDVARLARRRPVRTAPSRRRRLPSAGAAYRAGAGPASTRSQRAERLPPPGCRPRSPPPDDGRPFAAFSGAARRRNRCPGPRLSRPAARWARVRTQRPAQDRSSPSSALSHRSTPSAPAACARGISSQATRTRWRLRITGSTSAHSAMRSTYSCGRAAPAAR